MLNYESEVTNRPHCFEIWMCDLVKIDGCIQNGHRPVFVVSNDKNNKHSTVFNVIPITTKKRNKKLPVHVELHRYKEYGLTAPSTMLVEQPMPVSINRFDKKVGTIDDNETLLNIREAMIVQMPILAMA